MQVFGTPGAGPPFSARAASFEQTERRPGAWVDAGQTLYIDLLLQVV